MPERICAFAMMEGSGDSLAFHRLKRVFDFLCSSTKQ